MAGVTVVFFDGSELDFDCTLSQSHDRQAEVTEHSVEEGEDITDHVRVKPAELSISAIQSATPIRPFGVFGLAFAALTTGLNDVKFPHVAAYEKLLKAFEKGEPMEVRTGLKVYENMVIISLKVSKDSPTYDLPLGISFKKVNKVSSQTVKVPLSALGKAAPSATKPTAKPQIKKTQAQAAPKVAKGKAPSKPVAPPVAVKTKSVLFQVLGGKLPLR